MKRFGLAVWEFVVGEDWVAAAGVVASIALTALVAGTGIASWWVMPVCVPGILILTVRRGGAR